MKIRMYYKMYYFKICG